jgi:outer membrane receptor for ferrienterochelin and colicins
MSGSPTGDPTLLEELVVTATRNDLNAGKVPASFSVISRQQIDQQPAEDLIDLIRTTPGITFNGIGIGGRRTMSVRGMSDSQTLVLVDGRRQIDTNENIGYSDFGHNWIPLDSIERIEIVRGPLSSLWGAEALGGVVNIITRRPGDSWSGTLRVRGGAPDQDGGGQEFGSWLYASGPITDEALAMTLSAERISENNIPAREQPHNEATIDIREEKKRAGVHSKLSWLVSTNHELELSADYSDEERYTRSWDDRRDEPRDYDYNIKRSNLAADYTGLLGETTLRLRAFRTFIKTRRTYVPQGNESLKEAGNRIVSGEILHSGLDRNLLTLGGELRLEELDVPGFNAGFGGSQVATHQAVFAQDDIALTKDLSLVVGLRYDDHEFFGGEASPRAYAVWDARPGLQIKGGYGHGFKAPSLKQIHPDYYYEIASMIIVGNPDLEPETAESFELGAHWRGERFHAGTTLFTNAIENLIDSRVIGAEGRKNIYQPVNINEARTRGVEAEAGWLIGRGFRLEGNWTHLDARDLTLDLSLTDRPRNTLNLSLHWEDPLRGWRAGLRSETRSSQWLEDDDIRYKAEDFALWHLSIGKDFGESIELSLGVENLADRQLDEVSEIFNYYERGRFFTVGALYRLR